MSLADDIKRWEGVTLFEEPEPIRWNPRYLAYCRVHDKTPEEMLWEDEKKYPGGRMTGFMLWISEMTRAFHKESPQSFFRGMHGGIGDIVDFAAWDKFLDGVATTHEIVTEIIAEEKWNTLDNGLTPD